MKQSIKTVLGALLVGGTAIGAGMLALPLSTAGSSLLSAWVVYALCWGFSIATGLLFVEIGLWLTRNANIVSMATLLLGKWGKWAAWILYVFLFYCLTVAYVSRGGAMISEFFGHALPYSVSVIAFSVLFGSFVYLGTRIAGRFNALLMIGLILSYIGFIALGWEKVQFSFLRGGSWDQAIWGLPIIFTSFSYQGTIPSLFEYLDRDVKRTRLAIICGTSIPFIAYLLWDFIIKGIIPVSGPDGLLAAKAAGSTAIEPLKYFLQNSYVVILGNIFAFFALTTSFIGVTLGLLDFLADSLQIEKSAGNRLGICFLIYLPPILISLTNPGIFLKALGYAGGFGCALLLGLLPILMVWSGRYHKGYTADRAVLPGGRAMLLVLMAFVLFEVAISF